MRPLVLAAMAMAVLPLRQTEVRDGVLVGTLRGADAALLVVRADNGDEVSFLLDSRSDMPPGFVPGTRIAVRFEVLPDGRYRAASVSPPRIPSEPGAVNTLPPWPEQGPRPPNPPRPEAEPSRASSADSPPEVAPPRRESLASAPSPPIAAPPSAPPPSSARASSPAASPIPPPAVRTRATDLPPTPVRLKGGWLAAVAGLLVAAAVLRWLVRRPP